MTPNSELEGIVRSKEMEELLSRLRSGDSVYAHNVPQELLDELDDNLLLEHLRNTYSQKEFIIDDPELIKKYMGNHGQMVIKKGNFNKTVYKLKRGAHGVVTKVLGEKSIVKFKEYGGFRVLNSDLVVCGRVGSFFQKVKQYPATPASEFKLKRRDIVKYSGRHIYEINDRIPDGARGIVVHNWGSKGLDIAWIPQPGVRQWRWWNTGRLSSGACNRFQYDEVRLVVGNYIDFDQLYRECFEVGG